jgi:hypothetical protein
MRRSENFSSCKIGISLPYFTFKNLYLRNHQYKGHTLAELNDLLIFAKKWTLQFKKNGNDTGTQKLREVER